MNREHSSPGRRGDMICSVPGRLQCNDADSRKPAEGGKTLFYLVGERTAAQLVHTSKTHSGTQ